MVANIHSI